MLTKNEGSWFISISCAKKQDVLLFFFAVLSIGVFMFISACRLDFINLSPYFTTCERNSQKYDCNRVSSKNL